MIFPGDSSDNPEDLSSQSVDPKDTSMPGREEEVIVQHNSKSEPEDNRSPDTGEKRFREGLYDNDNEPQTADKN